MATIRKEIEELLIELVCAELGQPLELVKSKCRKHELCEARQVASYVILKNTKVSFQSIAERLNYKSHASPWRDLTQVETFLEIDKQFRKKVTPIIYKAYNLVSTHRFRLHLEEQAKLVDAEIKQSGELDFYQNIFYSSSLIIL
jgi:hypothetical protein